MAAVGLFMHRTDTVRMYPAPNNTYTAAVKRVHRAIDTDSYEIRLGPFTNGGVPRGHIVTIPTGSREWSFFRHR